MTDAFAYVVETVDTFSKASAKTLQVSEEVEVGIDDRAPSWITIKHVELAGCQFVPYKFEPWIYLQLSHVGDELLLAPQLTVRLVSKLDRKRNEREKKEIEELERRFEHE